MERIPARTKTTFEFSVKCHYNVSDIFYNIGVVDIEHLTAD